MRSIISIAVCALALVVSTSTPAQEYNEDFESYTLASTIIGQGGWEGWDSAPADGTVSNDPVNPGQSLQANTGTDVVNDQNGQFVSGKWTVTGDVYVPSTSTGNDLFFIVLNTYEDGGAKDWSTQVHFSDEGEAISDLGTGGAGGTGTIMGLATDEWHTVSVEVDLDSNTQAITVDGVFLAAGTWQATGVNEIDTFDLFSNGQTDGFYDNVTVSRAPYNEDFESYAIASTIIGQGGWQGWDSAPADGTVSVDPANPGQSLQANTGTDVVNDQNGQFVSGTWVVTGDVFVPSTSTGNDLWFIALNTYEDGGAKNWSVQVLFSDEGMVHSDGGSDGAGGMGDLPVATDEWHTVSVLVDLDSNTQVITVDGVFLAEGTWQTTGVNEIDTFDLFSNGQTDGFYDNVGVNPPPPPPPPGTPFLRGDFDNDGTINFLSDAVFGLAAGFIPGSPQPGCLAAVDANGDLTLNFLADSVFLLSAGFIPMSPLPPFPYPDCGIDEASTDALGCDIQVCP